jgi:hypothetical protein
MPSARALRSAAEERPKAVVTSGASASDRAACPAVYLRLGGFAQLLLADLDRQIAELNVRIVVDVVPLVPWETASLEKLGWAIDLADGTIDSDQFAHEQFDL